MIGKIRSLNKDSKSVDIDGITYSVSESIINELVTECKVGSDVKVTVDTSGYITEFTRLKYKTMVGNVIHQTDDGLITLDVLGSTIPKFQLDNTDKENKYVGKRVEVEFKGNPKVQTDDKGRLVDTWDCLSIMVING